MNDAPADLTESMAGALRTAHARLATAHERSVELQGNLLRREEDLNSLRYEAYKILLDDNPDHPRMRVVIDQAVDLRRALGHTHQLTQQISERLDVARVAVTHARVAALQLAEDPGLTAQELQRASRAFSHAMALEEPVDTARPLVAVVERHVLAARASITPTAQTTVDPSTGRINVHRRVDQAVHEVHHLVGKAQVSIGAATDVLTRAQVRALEAATASSAIRLSDAGRELFPPKGQVPVPPSR